MSQPGASNVYVAARRALLDALDALEEHLDALVLVGAQAVYVHTGEADVAVATQTKDGDLVINPERLSADPLLERAMESAGFRLNLERRQPGEWISQDGVPVDLLVPAALGGGGRRAARIPPHGRTAARKVTGLEPAVIDNEVMTIQALDPIDEREHRLAVAGPSALLVAKLHKLGDRRLEGSRLEDKDAHDVYRLIRAVPTEVFLRTIPRLRADGNAGEVTAVAVQLFDDLFGSPEADGSVMAGRAEELVGDPAVTSAAASALAREILAGLGGR